MNRILAVFISVLLFPAVGKSVAESDYFVSRVDYQSGLSHSAVLSIFQDRDGLMWFGTYDGVNCYDGREMEVFRSDFSEKTTLSNNVIHSICQADGNNLWFNTHLGLDRFSQDSREVTAVYNFNGDYSIQSDSSGDTWVVTKDTLWYYNTAYERFCPLDVPIDNGPGFLSRTFVSENGDLWSFPEGTGSVDIYSIPDFAADPEAVKGSVFRNDFHFRPVEQIFYQNGMICFLDSEKDLYLYDIQKRSKILVRNVASLIDKYGQIEGIIPFYDDIIIGFMFSGLVKVNVSDSDNVEEVDRNLRIYGLYKDNRQGILWVATDGAGAVFYAKKTAVASNLLFSSVSPNLTRQVRSIFTDNTGDLWVGTKGDGIVRVKSFADSLGGQGQIQESLMWMSISRMLNFLLPNIPEEAGSSRYIPWPVVERTASGLVQGLQVFSGIPAVETGLRGWLTVPGIHWRRFMRFMSTMTVCCMWLPRWTDSTALR